MIKKQIVKIESTAVPIDKKLKCWRQSLWRHDGGREESKRAGLGRRP
jgi:hypothetical protein